MGYQKEISTISAYDVKVLTVARFVMDIAALLFPSGNSTPANNREQVGILQAHALFLRFPVPNRRFDSGV